MQTKDFEILLGLKEILESHDKYTGEDFTVYNALDRIFNEKWITIKGNHILLKEGDTPHIAIKRFEINTAFKKIKNNEADEIIVKNVRRDLKKNYKTSLKVGDIMHGSWGYDMTINEFYQIIEIRNRTVILQEIGTLKKAMGHQDYDVKPRADYFIGEPIKRILQVRFYDSKPYEYIKLNEVCDLTKYEDTNRYYYENHWD